MAPTTSVVTHSRNQGSKRTTKKPACTQATILFITVLLVCVITMLYMTSMGDLSKSHFRAPENSPQITARKDEVQNVVSNALLQKHLITTIPVAIKVVDNPKKRLAFIITITKDGFFQDGAAVLAYSIMKNVKSALYDISFIAFVHPNVTSSRVGLRRLGFHVVEVPTPVNTSAIRFDFLREKIDKNGCCGAAELIKLTAYRFVLGLFPLASAITCVRSAGSRSTTAWCTWTRTRS